MVSSRVPSAEGVGSGPDSPGLDSSGLSSWALASSSLSQCDLFAGIAPQDRAALLDCIRAVERRYTKDQSIFTAGSAPQAVGLVVRGSVNVLQEDFWGNRMIISHVEPGGLFGEAFACARMEELPVSVVAAEKTQIMLLDYGRIVTTCTSACAFHTRLLMNMLGILGQKNVLLTRKMEHLARRTTREKVLSFLSAQAQRQGSHEVEIPFNRQELADYLCVERSALSRELGQMRKAGLVQYKKNRFVLAEPG